MWCRDANPVVQWFFRPAFNRASKRVGAELRGSGPGAIRLRCRCGAGMRFDSADGRE